MAIGDGRGPVAIASSSFLFHSLFNTLPPSWLGIPTLPSIFEYFMSLACAGRASRASLMAPVLGTGTTLGRCVAQQHQRSTPCMMQASRRSMAVFVTGHGWTGALGLGRDAMTDGSISDGSLVEGGEGTEELVELASDAMGGGSDGPKEVVASAAGWGHSAFIARDTSTDSSSSSSSSSGSSLYVAGRPHDFQTLLRLKRLPPFLRRYLVNNSLRYDDGTVRTDRETVRAARSAVTKLIDTFMSSGTDERENMMRKGLEDIEIRYGLYPTPTKVELPDGDEPLIVGGNDDDNNYNNALAASAGLTAVIGKSGTLYTFGLNHRGQCGVGENDMFNVWDATPVTGLSMKPVPEDDGQDDDDDDANSANSNDGAESATACKQKKKKRGRAALKQDRSIVSVALGLQHGLALNESGQLYSWGKGARGQLGIPNPGESSTRVIPDTEYSAVPVVDFCPDFTFDACLQSLNFTDEKRIICPRRDKILTGDDARVVRISAGLNHSAAITSSNLAWVWGKNILPYDPGDDGNGIQSSKPGKHAEDAPLPALVTGLPAHLAILDVACGSHHTSFLLEDGSIYAIGVATDTVRPIWGGAVEIIPPSLVDMPPRQFTAHFDRTTIVGKHGDQILEVQLWSHDELRDGAAFEPGWVDALLSFIDGDSSEKERGVRQVHKGWMHTVVVTD